MLQHVKTIFMVAISLIYVNLVVYLAFCVLDLALMNVQVAMVLMDIFIKLLILLANNHVPMEDIKTFKVMYAANAKEDA